MPDEVDPQWYKKIWTDQIHDLPWTEQTSRELDFVVDVLELSGQQRVLDLACGFGRHALELADRGYSVVGVDISAQLIAEARKKARESRLDAEFICADLRDVGFHEKFDVVLNLADGAIGYLENDSENLKIFDMIASALKPSGKHLMGLCNAAHANKHFPSRHWQMGSQALCLAEFAWDRPNRRMLYTSYSFKYGQRLAKPQGQKSVSSIRLYTIQELQEILAARKMQIKQTYGGYDRSIPACEDQLTLLVYSQKSLE